MRAILFLLAAMPSVALAQIDDSPPVWFVRSDAQFDPGLIRLADAGCPEVWPFSAVVYEDAEVREGEEVHVRYAETCSELQLVSKEARLSEALDALYLRLGELWRADPRIDKAMWDMRPRLVELHTAWKNYTDVECSFGIDLAFSGGTGTMMESLACGHQATDARLEWVTAMMAEVDQQGSDE